MAYPPTHALPGDPDEASFQEWYATRAYSQGLNPNPDDPRHFYDYRSAYLAGAEPDTSGHWPSQFKLEGHPNLVVDGVDTRTGQPAKSPPVRKIVVSRKTGGQSGGGGGGGADLPVRPAGDIELPRTGLNLNDTGFTDPASVKVSGGAPPTKIQAVAQGPQQPPAPAIPAPPPVMSRKQLAQSVRAKFATPEADPYGDLSDDELSTMVLAKYPVYHTWVMPHPALPGPTRVQPGPVPRATDLEATANPVPTRLASARTGGRATTPAFGESVFDRPAVGAIQAATGGKHLVTGEGGRKAALSDVIEGGMQAAEPLLLTGMTSATVAKTLGKGLVAGLIGSEAGGALADRLTEDPETRRLARNVAGVVTGVGAVEGPKLLEWNRTRPRPIPGVLEGPPERGGERPVPGTPEQWDAYHTQVRTAEAKDFAQGWAQAQRGEAAAQTTVSMQQQAERRAFEQRVAAGMHPMDAVQLEMAGNLASPPPGRPALPEAPWDVRAIIAHPPGEPVAPPNPNLREVTRPELAGGPRRVIAEMPPPTAEEAVSDALGAQLESQQPGPPRLVQPPYRLRGGPPPSREQVQLNLKARRGAMRGRIQGVGEESIARSGGGAITEGRQSRLRDLPEHAPAPPEAGKDPRFTQAAARARAEGYQGSDAELYRRYQEQVERADFLNEQNQEGTAYHPRTLLREVARLGGIHHPDEAGMAAGETRPVWEARDHPNSGAVGGVGRVLRRGGLSLNAMADTLRRNGFTWQGESDFPGWRLSEFIADAKRDVVSGKFDAVEPDLGGRWWERAPEQDTAAELADWFQEQGDRLGQDDLEHAYQEYLKLFGPGGEGGPSLGPESPVPVRTVPGEEQPSLPGTEAVRETETPTPEFEAPFSLTPPPAREAPPRQGGLFEEPPTRGQSWTSPNLETADPQAWVRQNLDRAGAGVPGLGVETRPSPIPAIGPETHIVYRGSDGQPIAAATVIDTPQGPRVNTFAADKTKGLAYGRAVAAVGRKLHELGATDPAGTMTVDARNAHTQAQRPGLFDRLKGEEGVLILDVPPGDPIGLKRWLGKNEQQYGDDPWFQRVQQALDDGNPARAWRLAAAASARDIAAIGTGRLTAEEKRAIQGTQFAQLTGRTGEVGPRGGVAAGGSGTTVVQAPPVRSGQRGQGITAGPTTGGLLRPPPVRQPLKQGEGGLAQLATDMLLGKTYQKSLLNATDPALVTLIENNRDTAFRLFRQVADQSIQGLNSREAKQYLKLSDAEIAGHYTRAITESARNLARLSSWRRQNQDALQFLRPTRSGELKFAGPGGQFMSSPPDWMNEPIHIGGGREIVPGVTPEDQTLAALSQEGASLEKLQAIWSITKPDPQRVGTFEALENLSRAFLVSKPVTAIRNFWTQAGRYSVAGVDDALTAAFSGLAGDTQGATEALQQLKFRTKALARPGVMARRPWVESMQGVYDYTAETVDSLPGTDARKLLGLLETYPREAADFMGYAAGELEPGGTGTSKTTGNKFLDDIALDPRVRNYLTLFNRAQEHTLRATTFDAVMRGQLESAGYNSTDLLSKPIADIREAVPEPQLQSMVETAVYRALDETFASVPLADSIPGRLLQTFSRHPLLLRFNYPFPRFNLLAAPRFIYDHSPAALADLLLFPFERGRLFRGVTGEHARTVALPELQDKLATKDLELGAAARQVISSRRELNVRERLLARAEKQGAKAGQLPETGDPVAAARDALQEARDAVAAAKEQVETVKEARRDLKAQIGSAQQKVRAAGQIGAPNQAQYWARMATGTLGLFGAALALRTSEGADKTEWYEYRWKRANGEESLIDLRSFAPFVQYLLPADVIADFYRHTDWAKVAEAMPKGTDAINPMNYLPLYEAVQNNYTGKYTPEKLSTDVAQAFLSMSRAAGTTLTIADLMTQQGWPGPKEIAQALVGSIGQFFARFTVPLSTLKEAVAQGSDEEALVRIAPGVSAAQPFGPLAAPLANVPFASRLIPETYSQTTGEPLRAQNPLGRELSGIVERQRSDIEDEFKRIGMPSRSVYIPRTGDQGLDNTLAQTYAKYLQQYLPGMLSSREYRALGTPADQRDFLGPVLSALRRAAVGDTKQQLGVQEVTGKQETPGQRREKTRREALIQRLEKEFGTGAPQEEPQPEPEPAATPPPGRG